MMIWGEWFQNVSKTESPMGSRRANKSSKGHSTLRQKKSRWNHLVKRNRKPSWKGVSRLLFVDHAHRTSLLGGCWRTIHLQGLTMMKQNETQGLLQTSSQTTLSERQITKRLIHGFSLPKNPSKNECKQTNSFQIVLPVSEPFESNSNIATSLD